MKAKSILSDVASLSDDEEVSTRYTFFFCSFSVHVEVYPPPSRTFARSEHSNSRPKTLPSSTALFLFALLCALHHS